MKLYCPDCESIFDEDEVSCKMIFFGNEIEPPEWEDPACPCCGSLEIVEAELCPICEEWHAPSKKNDELCDDCTKELDGYVGRMIKEIAEDWCLDEDAAKALVLERIARVW